MNPEVDKIEEHVNMVFDNVIPIIKQSVVNTYKFFGNKDTSSSDVEEQDVITLFLIGFTTFTIVRENLTNAQARNFMMAMEDIDLQVHNILKQYIKPQTVN